MPHYLSATDFTKEQLISLFQQAKEIQTNDCRLSSDGFSGIVLATVFLEPSTRTRLSFETAWIKGGGEVISIPNLETSSLNKGESLYDTGKMLSSFADIIAIRTPEKGQVEELAKGSSVPVINAGDGTEEHPTQNLLDLYTIWKERGSIDSLTIGIMGDCANSRVLRGMAKMLAQFKVEIIFICPKELQPKQDILDYLNGNVTAPNSIQNSSFENHHSAVPHRIVNNLQNVIEKLDVLELNRVRHEYFQDKEKALKIGEQFSLGLDDLKHLKPEAILLEPLPRINTFKPEVDALPQAKYFDAVKNGVPVRMALMKKLLAL
jgi:aspartate carbamoyltransferase catalytic subunit